MGYSTDYGMSKENRTKTNAAILAEERRAEMIDWLLTTPVQEEIKPRKSAAKMLVSAK